MGQEGLVRRVVLSFVALLAADLASPMSAHAVDPPTSSAPAADFDALVKKGDQARILGKWSDALKAYAAALEVRDDPLVAGRLGFVLVEFREYETAAGKLFQAIEQGVGANDAERMRFYQAFLVARKETCRLDVVVVQNGVKLEFDGEPRFGSRREFWFFVRAGKHKLKATLEGFEDETVDIDATKGGQISIKIELHPVKPAELPEKQADLGPTSVEVKDSVPEGKPAPVVGDDKPSATTNPQRKNGSFVVGLGGGLVLGATPTPAVGPNIFAAWRSRTWWEVGVDARAAWTFVKDERFPSTKFVTWSAQLLPCGRLKMRWIGCVLAQLDGTQRTDGLEGRLLPGFGLRGGVEFETHPRLALQIVGDLVLHYQSYEFHPSKATVSWTGSFVTGALGFRAVIKP